MGFLVNSETRDTQKERTTKSRNSWGAKAVRVRATGSPRAHPLEVVGHGRRSPRFLGFLVNSETRHTEGANNQISEKLGS